MPERSSYAEGAPCWADILTPDPEGAQRFYSAVLGWEFQDLGEEMGHYTMCLVKGQPVAAMMAPTPEMEGMSPEWNVYLATSDIGGALERVAAAGGQVALAAQEVPGAGTMAFAVDPAGGSFGLWQAAGHIGSKLWAEPGAMCWNQLATTGGSDVDAFYREVFGYAGVDQLGDGSNFDYAVWQAAGIPEGEPAQVAGRWRVPAEQLPGGRPSWDAFFTVQDADAAARIVANGGGKIVHGPEDSPYGRMCAILDPFGAHLQICQLPG
ncbi:VOC family protein [Phaeacidiphilus oryzae]|uniref:VOC family protein n=1 Tax=Phaeacidiphilus oryzae TaxID=348818 RepID=UPI0005639DA4|nr:VOC family protein [Phaeacidiphilus oryzae]